MSEVFVRCNSHRAREKLARLLGVSPLDLDGYYSWDRYCTGGWFKIPANHEQEAVSITGITRCRKTDDLRRCINW